MFIKDNNLKRILDNNYFTINKESSLPNISREKLDKRISKLGSSPEFLIL